MKRRLSLALTFTFLSAGVMALSAAAQCPAPGTSQPLGVSGYTQEPRTFIWSEVNDAMYYQLHVVKDGDVFHREWFMGDTEWTTEGTLFAGDYTFYVRTWNPCGYGSWSTGFSFNVACNGANAPYPTSPGGTYGIEYDAPFTFWRGNTEAKWYNIWLERDSKVVANLWSPYLYGYGYGSNHYEVDVKELGGPLSCGDYLWKVRSWSECGGTTAWGSEASFTVACCTGAPVKIDNIDLYEYWGYGAAVRDPRPLFEWTDNDDASWYNIYLERNGQAYHNAWTKDEEWSKDGDLPPGNYTVAVRGWNPCGFGAWSDGYDFTLECEVNDKPDFVHVLYGYGYGYGTVGTAVGWNEQDGVYWYQFTAQRDGQTVYSKWLDWTHPTHPLFGGSTVAAFPSEIRRHGDYQCWVRSWNHCGTSPWTDGYAFTVDCELTAPVLTGPTGVLHDPRPAFEWQPQEYVDQYRLYVQRNGAKYFDLGLDEWFLRYDDEEETSTFSYQGAGQGWNVDDEYWMVNLPFDFPFFDTTQDVVYVNSNGTLNFGSGMNSYTPNLNEFKMNAMIAVLWEDLITDGAGNGAEDIYLDLDATQATIRWQAEYLQTDEPVNCSATLYPDGAIRLSYGSGNARGGLIGISAGDGLTYLGRIHTTSKQNAPDIVLTPTASGGLTGASAYWDFPNGAYRWWLQPSSECFGKGPWSVAGEFTIDVP